MIDHEKSLSYFIRNEERREDGVSNRRSEDDAVPRFGYYGG